MGEALGVVDAAPAAVGGVIWDGPAAAAAAAGLPASHGRRLPGLSTQVLLA